MNELSWTEVAAIDESYADVLSTECGHHIIYLDENGTIRWLENPKREKEIMDSFGATDLNDLFGRCMADKNDPIIRELYKCIGYSLSGFWEVFYWDWNNEKASEYKCQ